MEILEVNELIFDMKKFNMAIANNYGETFEVNINLDDEKKIEYNYSSLKVHPKFLTSEPKLEDYINKKVEMNFHSKQINDFMHDLFSLNIFNWNEEPGEDSRPSNFYSVLTMEVPNVSLIEKKFNFTYCKMWDYLVRIVEELVDELIPIQMVEYIS